jgi:hypothetical protein
LRNTAAGRDPFVCASSFALLTRARLCFCLPCARAVSPVRRRCDPRGILPLGKSRKDWNFSLQDKRVLNFENEVSDSDNVKQARARRNACACLCKDTADASCVSRRCATQDISIDVYGRTDETSAPTAPKK